MQIKFIRKASAQKLIIPLAVVFAVVFIFTTMYLKRKTITVIIDGEQRVVTTYRNTVAQALKTNDIFIGPKDKITPSLDSRLEKDQSIIIKTAVNVNVRVDGKDVALLSSEEDIGALLKTEGIELGDNDRVEPDMATGLTEGMNIKVVRVEYKTITETVPIPFKEVVQTNKSLENTKRHVSKEGKEGEKEVTTKITYEDGVEVAREVVGEKVTRAAQDRIIVQGTYPYMPVSRGGSILPYSRVFEARATAYWAVRGVGKPIPHQAGRQYGTPMATARLLWTRRSYPMVQSFLSRAMALQ